MKDIITNFAVGAASELNTVGDGKDTLFADIKTVVNIIIGALGIVCVIIIIIGGIGYMTSAGDSSKVKKAKDTILYGLIGLVVCVLAFAIVNWLITALGSK